VLSNNAKKCLPIGMPTFMTNEFALEIIESSDRGHAAFGNSALPRSVYLHEKTHTQGLEPAGTATPSAITKEPAPRRCW